jgi:predicted amidohydrolase YtcJ
VASTGAWIRRNAQSRPGREIDRVSRAYPHLYNDEFVAAHLEEWMQCLKRVMCWRSWLAPSGAGVARQGAVPADLVMLDARILTVDEQFTEARGLAVRDGRFVAVGSNEDIKAYVRTATRVIEGRGRTVVPGLIDTHVHALGVAAAETEQPFRISHRLPSCRTGSVPQAKRRSDGWIWTPRVYPTRLRERRFPTRKELDAASPERRLPSMALMRCLSTPPPLRAAGITRDSPDPPGGAIVKDISASRQAFCETWERSSRGFTPKHRRASADGLERVHQQYVATGITSVIERAATVDGIQGVRRVEAREPPQGARYDHDSHS